MSTRRITTLRPLLVALIAIAGATAGVGAATVLRPRPAARPAATPRIICSPALPCLAVVIDDVGRDLRALEQLLALDSELTFSVLPHAAQTEASLAAIRRAGRELMLHLPMAPHDRSRISDESIVLGVGEQRLEQAAAECLRRVPDAVAFNNHMGSELSRDPAALRILLGVAQRARLAVLDSRTVERSRLCELARERGMRCLERDLFLDDPPGADVIVSAWVEGLKRARARGWAVLIAHPHPESVRSIGRLILERAGVRIVRFSQLLRAVDAT